MAIKTKAQLLTEAEVIRDEVITNANTALRVGQHSYDSIDSMFPGPFKSFYANINFSGSVKDGSGDRPFAEVQDAVDVAVGQWFR